MKALGLIETRGLLAAIESVDTMLKAADVSIFDKTYVGGGLVSVSVTGDVGAVKAAVEAGVAAVEKLDSSLLVSEHVIPRPHEELESIIGVKSTISNIDNSNEDNIEETSRDDNSNSVLDNLVEESSEEKPLEVNSLEDEIEVNLGELDLDNLQKEVIDNLVKDDGVEKTIEVLNKLKLTKLRSLANQYDDLGITDEVISKASKKLLINKIAEYYK